MSNIVNVQRDQVRMGMFIHAFGGLWFSHPFGRSGFLVDAVEDLEVIRGSKVDHVVIDLDRSRNVPETLEHASKDADARPLLANKNAVRKTQINGSSGHERWIRAQSSRHWEQQRARAIMVRAHAVIRRVFEAVRLGRPVPVEELRLVVEDVVEGVIRDSSALLSLARAKKKNEYLHLHSVSVCILAVNLANHLGLDEAEVQEIGMTGLLYDVGKVFIDHSILDRPDGLTDAEWTILRAQPRKSFDLLVQADGFSRDVFDASLNHRERMDGRDYPSGLAAEELSLASRLGAICDVYDAVTSSRPDRAPWSPEKAVTEMWRRDGHFDRCSLFSFMQSIGAFPPGMLVRTRCGRLGIVLDPSKRTKKIIVRTFYGVGGRSFLPLQTVKASTSLRDDGIVAHEDPADWGFSNWPELSRRVLDGTAGPDELATISVGVPAEENASPAEPSSPSPRSGNDWPNEASALATEPRDLGHYSGLHCE